jgi:Glycosyltransferase family 87
MTRAAVERALGAAVVAACWASAGVTPLTDAVAGAAAPADWARDYVTARARLEDGRAPPPEGAAANERAQRWGVPPVVLLDGPYYLHPPPALLPVLPLAALPWPAAARAFAALSLVALIWLARSLLALYTPGRRPRPAEVALLAGALALWPPALHNLEKGQWSIVLAALLAAGARSLEDQRAGRAGAMFGLAAALKATPLVLAGLLWARSRRAAGAMALTLAAAGGAALAVTGFAFFRAFFVDTPRDVGAWSTWVANTASLQGVFARLLQSGPFSRPLVVAPVAARAAFAVTGLALLAAAVAVGVRRFRGGGPVAGDGRALSRWTAAWLALPVLLNPLGWTHVVLMLLPPLALALRDGGRGCRWATVLTLAALSIPRQRLLAWAGPIPVGPAAGLLLGVHAFAALAFYAVILAASASATVLEPAPRAS